MSSFKCTIKHANKSLLGFIYYLNFYEDSGLKVGLKDFGEPNEINQNAHM